eukprot:Gb_22363 [translate_table: standard]
MNNKSANCETNPKSSAKAIRTMLSLDRPLGQHPSMSNGNWASVHFSVAVIGQIVMIRMDVGEKISELANKSQSSQLRDKKGSEREMVVKKLCVRDIDDNDHPSIIIPVKEATCYRAPWTSTKKSSGSSNLSAYFDAVTNQECSTVFRASNRQILLYNLATNDNILEGPCAEGFLESEKHGLKGVNHDDGQNVSIVGTLAIDLRGINYNSPFGLIVGLMVIDTRVFDPRIPTLGTIPVSTIAVDLDIPVLDMYRNLEQGQKIKEKLTRPEVQDREGFYRKVDNQGCENFGEFLKVTGRYGSRGCLVVSSNTQMSIKEQFSFLAGEIKDIVYQDPDAQARPKRSRGILLAVANTGVAGDQIPFLGNVESDVSNSVSLSEEFSLDQIPPFSSKLEIKSVESQELVAVKVERSSMPFVSALDAHLVHMIGSQLKRLAKARRDLLAAVNEMVRHTFDEIDLGLIGMLVHFVKRDSLGLANDFLPLGFIPKEADIQPIANALQASIGDEATKSHMDFYGIMNQLSDVMYRHNFSLPPNNALVIRALGSLEGTTKTSDVVASAYPFILGRLLADLDPDMRNTLRELLIHGISTVSQQSKNENGPQKQWVSGGRDKRSHTSWNHTICLSVLSM